MFDVLPAWAALTLNSAPFFGSEEDGAPEGEPAGATVTDPPEEKPEGEKPVNVNPDDHAKVIRERDQTKSELAALQQEKQERDEAEAQAVAATRSKEENQDAQIQQLTKDNGLLMTVNETNLLELAVLKNKKFDWQDPAVAMKLIDRTNVKIDAKKGIVEGVDDALKELAKESPYLLRRKDGNDDGNSGSGGKPLGTPGNASGGTPTGNKDASSKANKRAELEKRFNVLRV